MSNFKPATGVLGIAEMQYATAAKIKFGGFSSCLGLMALKDGQITGVHLAMFTSEGLFDEQDAKDALQLLPPGPSDVVLIGFCSQWQQDLAAPYLVLTAGLASFNKRVIDYIGSGVTVEAEVIDGKIATSRVAIGNDVGRLI